MVILVLGGASSGKSGAAETLVAQLPAPITYVATLVPDDDDADLMQRIAKHRDRRPSSWTTVDAGPELAEQLRTIEGTVLLDSLGPWVSRHDPDDTMVSALLDALRSRRGDTVVVSDEVGMSVHPPTEWGRAFQEAIGATNQRIAAVADQTVLVVAGRMLTTAELDISTITGGRV